MKKKTKIIIPPPFSPFVFPSYSQNPWLYPLLQPLLRNIQRNQKKSGKIDPSNRLSSFKVFFSHLLCSALYPYINDKILAFQHFKKFSNTKFLINVKIITKIDT